MYNPKSNKRINLGGDELGFSIDRREHLQIGSLVEDVVLDVLIEGKIGEGSIGGRSGRGSEVTDGQDQKSDDQEGQGGETENADHDTSDLTTRETVIRGTRAAVLVTFAVTFGRGSVGTGLSRHLAVEAACFAVLVPDAPPAGQPAAAGSELGGTGGTVEDARAIDHTVCPEDAITGGSLAGDIPADGRKRQHALTVATTGVDASSLGVTVIAVAEIVVLGAVAAGRAVLHGHGDTTALKTFALGAFVGGDASVFGIASFLFHDFGRGTILRTSGEVLDVGAILVLLVVIHLTDSVEADEALALGETARCGRIARQPTSAVGAVLDGHGGSGVAGAGSADVLRATETVVGFGVGRGSAINAVGIVLPLAHAVVVAQQIEATAVFDRGTGVGRTGTLLVDLRRILQTHAGTQLVGTGTGVLVEAVIVLAGIFASARSPANGGSVLVDIRNVHAFAGLALGIGTEDGVAIGSKTTGVSFPEIGSVNAAT